jgi:N-acetyl-anhydromuramyl-L-alanine amidase AmpD
MPRKIDLIVVHCSDSDRTQHDNVKTIRAWHTGRGFTGPDGVPGTQDDIGYHFVITKDGKIHPGRDVNRIGAHVMGHNSNSIGICLTGKDRFSDEQKQSLESLCKKLCSDYNLKKLDILGHRDLDKKGKTCPNFDVKQLTAQWIWH